MKIYKPKFTGICKQAAALVDLRGLRRRSLMLTPAAQLRCTPGLVDIVWAPEAYGSNYRGGDRSAGTPGEADWNGEPAEMMQVVPIDSDWNVNSSTSVSAARKRGATGKRIRIDKVSTSKVF